MWFEFTDFNPTQKSIINYYTKLDYCPRAALISKITFELSGNIKIKSKIIVFIS